MATHINNINELQKALQPVLVQMVDTLADEVYETLNYFLHDYYTGWTPESYRRTRDFLYSAVKVDAKPCKGGAQASVYINYDAMDNYVDAAGFQVAEWANQGMHGGLSVSHKPHVWDDTMDETINNGSLLQLAIEYLRKRGISVRN